MTTHTNTRRTTENGKHSASLTEVKGGGSGPIEAFANDVKRREAVSKLTDTEFAADFDKAKTAVTEARASLESAEAALGQYKEEWLRRTKATAQLLGIDIGGSGHAASGKTRAPQGSGAGTKALTTVPFFFFEAFLPSNQPMTVSEVKEIAAKHGKTFSAMTGYEKGGLVEQAGLGAKKGVKGKAPTAYRLTATGKAAAKAAKEASKSV